MMRYYITGDEYFVAESVEQVRVLWGLDAENPVTEWSPTEGQTPKKMAFSSTAAAISKEGQQKILNLCEAPTAKAGTLRCQDKKCLMKGSAAQCAMSSFMGVGYTTDPLCHTSRYCIMEQ